MEKFLNQTEKMEIAEVGAKNENAFKKSSMTNRSPVATPVTSEVPAAAGSSQQGVPLGLLGGSGCLSQVQTPKSSTVLGGTQSGDSRVTEMKKRVDELYEFIKDKSNVHLKIKQLVTSLKSAANAAEKEQKQLKLRAESAEKALRKVSEQAAVDVLKTPKGRPKKRDRESPGAEEDSKKQCNEQGDANDVPSKGENDRPWNIVTYKKEKPKKQRETDKPKTQKETKKERPKKVKSRQRRERSKGDAILVTANDQATYTEILRKVREDPDLKDLGENVVRTRRTLKGEMLIELVDDATVKSSAYQRRVAESLGDCANVKALTQEAVVVCQYLDEITTVEEMDRRLREQCNLDKEEVMAIRLTKSYDGTQTATIRLPVATANKLVEQDKVKIGWSICHLRLVTRAERRMMRCFKCMSFGHQAARCEGPDRTQLCRRCGEEGHFGKDCKKRPKCLLCKPEEGNAHSTGSLRCRAYKRAIAARQ